jgi:GntR family transcriptional regulator
MVSGEPPVTTHENRSLTDRAREELLRAIREDRFPDGRLPPEPQLAGLLGVSRTTIRAALQSLSADGLISRRRRHGTFVNRHLLRSSMRLNRLVAFATLVEQCGYASSTDPQETRVTQADIDQAAELEIPPGTEVLVAWRLLRAAGQPVITVTDVVPLARLSVPADAVGAADTTFDFLRVNAGATVDYATSEFVPRAATTTEPKGLGLPPGTPFIELREMHFTREHERLALSVVCVDDRLVRLSMLRRGL